MKKEKIEKYTCKKCKETVDSIGITSLCDQIYRIRSNLYTDLSVGDTMYGFCLKCGKSIPEKDLKKITGLEVDHLTNLIYVGGKE